MRSFIFLLFGLTFANGFDIQHARLKRQASHATQRQRYPITTNTQTTADGVPILTQPYVNSRAASTSTRQLQPSNPDHGLSLYDDFVNDPWRPTQDLQSLISERRPPTAIPSRDLRSGHHTDPRDNLWNRRPAYGQNWSDSNARRSYERPQRPIRLTESTDDHRIGQKGSDLWFVTSKSGDHITYVKRKSSLDGVTERRKIDQGWRVQDIGASNRTRSWSNQSRSSLPYGENGDEEWIVESVGDGHITYRRRRTHVSHPNRYQQPTIAPIQRLGQGRGEVLARVVKTGGSDETNDFDTRRRQRNHERSQLASYKSMQKNYAHSPTQGEESFHPQQGWRPTLQLKSGDSVSYLAEDGSEVVYPRFRGGDSIVKPRQRIQIQPQPIAPVHSPTNRSPQRQRFEQEGDWRVVSKDDSHVTWNRVESDVSTVRPYYYTRPTQSTFPLYHSSSNEGRPWYRETRTSGPHYPMLYEKETEERANRLGASNTMTLVY